MTGSVPSVDGAGEWSMLADNAAEVGLAWEGPPVVDRRRIGLPDGRHVSAVVWGTAPPRAVLVHGSAQNAHTWDTVALLLGVPLVAVDLPGHGHSSWRPDHDYSPASLAADLEPVVEALAPRPCPVVGMSLGGLTAIALAARRPDLVPRLVLVDITPGVTGDKARAITEFVSGPERFDRLEDMVARTIEHHPWRSESSLRRGVHHNARQLPDGTWSWRWDPVRLLGRAPVDDARPALGALWDDLAATDVPLTLIRGGASPVVDDDDVAELRRRRPDAEVVTVEGAGHSVQGDRPVELAGVLGGLLGRSG